MLNYKKFLERYDDPNLKDAMAPAPTTPAPAPTTPAPAPTTPAPAPTTPAPAPTTPAPAPTNAPILDLKSKNFLPNSSFQIITKSGTISVMVIGKNKLFQLKGSSIPDIQSLLGTKLNENITPSLSSVASHQQKPIASNNKLNIDEFIKNHKKKVIIFTSKPSVINQGAVTLSFYNLTGPKNIIKNVDIKIKKIQVIK